MAIARRLIELMQGELVIQSVLGQGTTVTATMRLKYAAPSVQPAVTPVRSEAIARLPDNGGNPWRVLLVDDSEGNRQVVRLYLENEPIVLEEASNGLEALTRVKADNFDVVLMDHVMPIMDGMTATRAIRDHERAVGSSPIHIVCITARAFPEDEVACLEAGCTAYLSKPVRRAALIAILGRLLRDKV